MGSDSLGGTRSPRPVEWHAVFRNANDFSFVPPLEAAFDELLRELDDLGDAAFRPSPDSLTRATNGYDERGWLYYDLVGGPDAAANSAHCPVASRVCAAVPGLVNAGFSLLRPGTHLYPHRGELAGVLRCHLALLVPTGDAGLGLGTNRKRWEAGRCLVFDDTHEHEAWNHGDTDRVVLLLTFRP